MTLLIIAPYKYSYLLTVKFLVDNIYDSFVNDTYKLILEGVECYNDTEIKAYDITELIAELKSDAGM